MDESSGLKIYRAKLVDANGAMVKALASEDRNKIRDSLQNLSSFLHLYVGLATKETDPHEVRHIIDALQSAVHAILPETRPKHVHGTGRPPRRADPTGHS